MKQIISALPIVFLFLAMLFSPKAVFEGAESGLLLWFQIVFPTLFPFMLISGLMLAGGGINIIARLFGRMFSVLFATSKNGAFAVITGFLCGYPMGAKVSIPVRLPDGSKSVCGSGAYGQDNPERGGVSSIFL